MTFHPIPIIRPFPCTLHPESFAVKDGRCAQCCRIYRRRHYQIHGVTQEQKYKNAIVHARLRSLSFTLSFDEWREIVSHPCVYALGSINPEIRVGIDRRDPRQGYTRDNSQPCCERHNRLKSDILTHAQALETIARYQIPCENKKRGRPRL